MVGHKIPHPILQSRVVSRPLVVEHIDTVLVVGHACRYERMLRRPSDVTHIGRVKEAVDDAPGPPARYLAGSNSGVFDGASFGIGFVGVPGSRDG
jgi:hypothetical protein